jgi:hypothetical protein
MIFRLRHETKGKYVHGSLFCGPHDGALGKCGDFTMTAEQFDHLAWLTRGRIEFVPPTRFVEPASPGSLGLANHLLDQVRLRLTPQEYHDLFWVVTTALDDSFELGIKSAGGDVVDLGSPRAYQRVEPAPLLRASAIAADWFTLPPNMRTKARLIEMLENNGSYA